MWAFVAEFENGGNQMILGGLEEGLLYCRLKFGRLKRPNRHIVEQSSPILRGFTSLDKMESKKEVVENHGVKSAKGKE